MGQISELEKRAAEWGEAHGYYMVPNRDSTPGWIHDNGGALEAVDWNEFHDLHRDEIEASPAPGSPTETILAICAAHGIDTRLASRMQCGQRVMLAFDLMPEDDLRTFAWELVAALGPLATVHRDNVVIPS